MTFRLEGAPSLPESCKQGRCWQGMELRPAKRARCSASTALQCSGRKGSRGRSRLLVQAVLAERASRDEPRVTGLPAASSNVGSGGEVLIELCGVHKGFGSKKILQGATIQIRRGEAVGIIGASGTGKSTTLRIMAGLLTPDEGEVKIVGQKRKGLLADDPELASRLKVGMVFQNGALFDSLTVGENVGFLLYEHSKLPLPHIERLVAAALASVGLSGVENLLPSELSGGMRKRVALARAIIQDDTETDVEQVIMYDEPTAGLDPVASTVVEDLIRALHTGRPPPPAHSQGSNGAYPLTTPPAGPVGGISSYIVVTHQHSTIRRACDRVVFLDKGSVAEFDTTSEPIVRQFASGSLKGPIRYE